MRHEVTLITGANGEIGHGLITQIGLEKRAKILALDLKPIDDSSNLIAKDLFRGIFWIKYFWDG